MRIRSSLAVFLLSVVHPVLFGQGILNNTPAASATTAGIPKGDVLQFSLKQSTLYPGTSRSYWVYIPKEYKPERAACLFVCMDGVIFNAPAVFDTLIAAKAMPVSIGVFIQSGTIMKNDSTIIRYNRTNEFDNMNDRFSRFIETEVLPDVAKQKTSSGARINISANPNDRAIAGASSGAICAFTAAWQRPDLFGRVFSAIGTYIGMRGGDQYPVLIRKTEPKAIRIYLQDNDNDTWNPLFGNWFKANTDMEAALTFAGYEVSHTWQQGGHDTRQATAIFSDAMRWLWKGWPEGVKTGRSGNDLLKTIMVPDEHWVPAEEQLFSDTYPYKSSDAVLLPDGNKYILQNGMISFAAAGKTVIMDQDARLGNALAVSPDKTQLVVSGRRSHWLYNYIIQPDGSLTDKQPLYWLHNPGNNDTAEINCLAFDTNGNLYVATEMGVQVCDQNGRVRAVLSLPAGPVTSLWFGGDHYNTLFVTANGKSYKRRLAIAGARASDKAVKVISQGGG